MQKTTTGSWNGNEKRLLAILFVLADVIIKFVVNEQSVCMLKNNRSNIQKSLCL